MTEMNKLQALLAAEDQLSDEERVVFASMLDRLKRGVQKKLSLDQRSWVEDRYSRLELDADEGSLNLVSSGIVAKTDVVLPYERLPRPMKPPGRM